jgi:hypothetical protein
MKVAVMLNERRAGRRRAREEGRDDGGGAVASLAEGAGVSGGLADGGRGYQAAWSRSLGCHG